MRLALLIGTTAMAIGAMSLPANAAAGPQTRDDLQESLDSIVTAGATGAIAQVRHGRQVWRLGSGTIAPGGAAVRGNEKFRAGSSTKPFVATVILQLVAEREIRLDDPVERWLPGVVPGGSEIRIRHLLGHTSGLADVLRTIPLPPSPDFEAYRWRDWTMSELVARATSLPPLFAPGDGWSYSNTNYLLLGMVIERVTHQSYADEIKRRLIWPLGLSDTSLPGTELRIHGPHLRGFVGTADMTELNPSLMSAGGELISTTADLSKFHTALLRGRLVPKSLLEQMKAPARDGATYGLGLRWRTLSCGDTVYGHDGDALGYSTWSFTNPRNDRQITVNITPPGPKPRAEVNALLDKALC
ncbi:beta-lactamase family protein [Kribbella sp. NBC_01245]|uniref:serine hydrolase domain-containing protein n=1 Tax=Kribbella sp. NBC_01245 TaxID=2903578 RepID=UPI002E2C46C8|nr:serine hydrolase domain-containing protein [Kribbella sp. NBC_01245]